MRCRAVTRWRPGDRVYGVVGGGGFGQYVVPNELCVAAVPDSLSDEEAAPTPEAWITAHDALTGNGSFQPGDRVLVNGANGAVGAAALQLVLAWHGGGYEPFRLRARALRRPRQLGQARQDPPRLLQLSDRRPAMVATKESFERATEVVGGVWATPIAAELLPTSLHGRTPTKRAVTVVSVGRRSTHPRVGAIKELS